MSVLDQITGAVLRVHQAIYESTNGAIGHRMIGVPSLLLRTTGRRTGATRTAALVYARDASSYIVTASNGGADRAPGWLHNIRAKSDVEIQIGRTRSPANARVIDRGDADYPRLWELVNVNNGRRYDRYQAQTERPIALVALTPSEGSALDGA